MTDSDASGERPTELQTLKGTYLLTPRGGFLDARNQNRDPEPSAKPLRESDKPTSPEILCFASAQPGTSRKGTRGGEGGLEDNWDLRDLEEPFVPHWDPGSSAGLREKNLQSLFTDQY